MMKKDLKKNLTLQRSAILLILTAGLLPQFASAAAPSDLDS